MIILDTNVVSELMRPSPASVLAKWLANYSADELHSSSVTLAEVFYGIEVLPPGKRKDELLAGAERLFSVLLRGRILGFDELAARKFARIAAERRRRGRPIAELDAQIAAIASANGATLATRNTADFEGCRIRVVNPWVD